MSIEKTTKTCPLCCGFGKIPQIYGETLLICPECGVKDDMLTPKIAVGIHKLQFMLSLCELYTKPTVIFSENIEDMRKECEEKRTYCVQSIQNTLKEILK